MLSMALQVSGTGKFQFDIDNMFNHLREPRSCFPHPLERLYANVWSFTEQMDYESGDNFNCCICNERMRKQEMFDLGLNKTSGKRKNTCIKYTKHTVPRADYTLKWVIAKMN